MYWPVRRQKYGGEFVPAHQAVIHSYMRERYAGGGKMIIGSDSHTCYGAYGTVAIGEGGPELARQLLKKTYNIAYPKVIAVYLTGAPRPGVGPQDVALTPIGETFPAGVVKTPCWNSSALVFRPLAMEYRNGIDVMTTETACLPPSGRRTKRCAAPWLYGRSRGPRTSASRRRIL